MKYLNYEEFMVLAREYYNEGGCYSYECMEQYQWDNMVEICGPMTREQAIEMFHSDKAVFEDRESIFSY